MDRSPQLYDRPLRQRSKRRIGGPTAPIPPARRGRLGGARFAAEFRHFLTLGAALPVCTADGPLCYSPLPFRMGAARPLRRGFSRGFGAVPKGFSGIKHRHNERELAAMKLTIERAALLRALGHVQSVVERRNTIPILSNVLLRAEDGQLSLSATDMDLEIVASVAAQGAAQGRRPRRRRTRSTTSCASCARAPRSRSRSTGDKGAMTLRSGRSTFTLACLPPEDYPLMAGGELPHSFTLSATDLKRLIDRTRFAISTEETRYYLNGIYLHAAKSSDAQHAARGRDRRPPPGARWRSRCPRAPPACPASSCRARP